MIVKGLTGERFGRLLVVEQVLPPIRYTRWRCLCDCGNVIVATRNTLKNGYTKSCGCLHRDQASANLARLHAAGRLNQPKRQGDAWRDLAEAMG